MAHRRDEFATHVGAHLSVVGNNDVTWRLADVSPVARSGDFESYSIVFETADPAAAQGLVTLDHADLGELELFVVAIGPGRYEAVFNQLLGEPA